MDAMLASMQPGIMDEWLAFRRIEPDVAELVRQLTETVKAGFSLLCAAQNLEVTADELDFSHPDPDAQPHQEQEMSPAQGAAIASAHLGAPDERR